MLSKSRTRGSIPKPTIAMPIGTIATATGVKEPTSRDPISQRTVRNVSVKSARYRTNAEIAERSEVSVTPASSNTSVEGQTRLMAAATL